MKPLRPVAVATTLAIALSACHGGQGALPPQGPPEVGVVELQAQSLPLTTELPGRTTPYLIAEVRPAADSSARSVISSSMT